MKNGIGWTVLAILILQAPLGRAQTAPAAPQFDVASVKLNTNCGAFRGGKMPFSPGRINMECTTLQDLVLSSYAFFANGVSLNQEILEITGGPSWAQSDHYDVTAKADGAVPVAQMMGPMLRALLEDRFKLKIHRQSKEMPVYSLTVAKSGLKIQPMKEGACVPVDLNHLPQPESGQPRPNFCGNMSLRMSPQGVTLDTHGLTMKEFAQRLSSMLDRTVIDKTEVSGQFDFHLEFAPDETTRGFGGRGAGDAGASGLPATPEGPSIISALQEKFGLKLMPDKGQVDTLVIDHVEKPTEN